MLDAVSFLLEPFNVACHSLHIRSNNSNFIHLCVFKRLGKLKNLKEGKPLLFLQTSLKSFPRTSLEQMLSKSFFQVLLYSPFQMPNSSNFINWEASRIWFEKLSILSTICGGFEGFFRPRHLLFLPTLSVTLLPF